jgi:hypothetical protein
MSAKPRRGKRRMRTIQVWTYDEARKLVPYLRSVMLSLREHRLAAASGKRDARRLGDQPGRPGRQAMIARQEALAREQVARKQFLEAQEELEALDIYCLDPIGGQAVVPFVNRDKLAWFVYDLFDDEPLRFWRYHGDSLETRRPIKELDDQPPATMVA